MTGAVDGAVMRPASSPVLPALIAGAGDRASLRFLEYFTVNIRNKNTRAASGRTAGDFLNSLNVRLGDAGDFAFSVAAAVSCGRKSVGAMLAWRR